MIDGNKNKELWTGRYSVRAEISYRDRKGKISTLHEIYFQPDMSDKEVVAILETLDFSLKIEGYQHLVSQTKDTFSQAQAEKLVAYLNERKGTKAYMKQALQPQPMIMGASEIHLLPTFRDRSVYKVYLEPGYNLDFKVESVNMKTFIAMAHLYQELRGQDLQDNT